MPKGYDPLNYELYHDFVDYVQEWLEEHEVDCSMDVQVKCGQHLLNLLLDEQDQGYTVLEYES